jgi:hypothetical protein
MAASLAGRETGSRGSSTVGKCSHVLCAKESNISDYQSKPLYVHNHVRISVIKEKEGEAQMTQRGQFDNLIFLNRILRIT